MKRLCLFLLLFCGLAFSQDSKNGTITTSGSDCTTAAACVSLPLASTSGAVGLSLSGTFTGTAQFEVSADNGATWVSASGTPPGSTTTATSATAAGTWRFAVSGLTTFRVRASALSAGSITVTIQSSQTSASLGGSGGGFTPPVTAPTFPGAQSVFLFNEGSGTTLTDSVSGNNCTLGTSGSRLPTWVSTSGSLSFSNSVTTCPAAAFSGAKEIHVWLENFINQYTSSTNNAYDAVILSSDDASTAIQCPQDGFGSCGFGGEGESNPNAPAVWASDEMIGPSSIAVVLDASTPKLYINGQAPLSYISQAGTAASFPATTNAYIGGFVTSANFGLVGKIHAIVAYPTQRTQVQIGRDEAVMRSYLAAQRGLTFQDYTHRVTPALIMDGDSIPCGGGGITVRGVSYPVLGQQLLGAKAGQYFQTCISGVSAQTIAGNINNSIVPIIKQFGIGNSVYYLSAGHNDLAAGAAAATILGYYKTICDAIHTANAHAKCVVSTVLPGSDITGGNETARTTLDASVIAGWLAGVSTSPDTDGVVDLAGDPIMAQGNGVNANATYYIQAAPAGVHPTQAGHALMPSRYACGIMLAQTYNVPCWMTISVDFISLNATAGTTKTLNLLQLGPTWKVCGVTNRVTTAFTGGAISAMTVTIGDSLGTATTYMGSQSIFTATYKDGGYPTAPAVGAGIVQGAFTSTTANLSALTAGRMNVNICVVNQN